MKLGWLWLSILNTQASPSPMSITPAFSPGPWITQGALVGSVRKWILEDLYEQCSFHIAEKMPSSVKLGVREISARMRSYSSGLRPWASTSAGVTVGCLTGFLLAMLDEGLVPPISPSFRRDVRAAERPNSHDILGRTSAPIPKFASHCGRSVCELRNQRCTSNVLIPSAAFEFEVPKRVCGDGIGTSNSPH